MTMQETKMRPCWLYLAEFTSKTPGGAALGVKVVEHRSSTTAGPDNLEMRGLASWRSDSRVLSAAALREWVDECEPLRGLAAESFEIERSPSEPPTCFEPNGIAVERARALLAAFVDVVLTQGLNLKAIRADLSIGEVGVIDWIGGYLAGQALTIAPVREVAARTDEHMRYLGAVALVGRCGPYLRGRLDGDDLLEAIADCVADASEATGIPAKRVGDLFELRPDLQGPTGGE